MRKRFCINIMGGVGLQTQWDRVSSRSQYQNLFDFCKDRRSVAAHNRHSNISNQYSGIIMTVFERTSGYTTPDMDATGLGWWSWIVLNSGYIKTIFIPSYRPVMKSSVRHRGVY